MPLIAYPQIARVSRQNRQFAGGVRLSTSPRITHFVRLPTSRTHDHAGQTLSLITAITLPSQRHTADRPTRPVQPFDDRHDIVPDPPPANSPLAAGCPRPSLLCHYSPPPLLFQVVPLSPRSAYASHGGPAEQ